MKKCFIIVFLLTTYCATNAQEQVEHFTEPFSKSYPIRQEQHLEIKAYVDKLLREEIEISLNKFLPDYFSVETYENSLYPYREQLGDYLGYPPPKARKGKVSRFEKIGEDKYSVIYRVWIKVVEGVHAYGIYMVPKNIEGKAPLIVAIHGGGGNPEAIVGLDTRINYHFFGQEAVKRGYAVWAPGLTMLSGYANDPKIPGVSRDILDKQLRMLGSSIIGLEIYKIIESTKTLIHERAEIDSKNVGMTGLSWGGYFTMYAAALCPFIKAAAISGNFRDSEAELNKIMDFNLINSLTNSFDGFGYFQAIGMICPRPCLVQLGEQDSLFGMGEARAEAKRASFFYEQLGMEDNFKFASHPGGHEFEIEGIFDFFGENLK